MMPDNKQFKALLGATVMLSRMARGESFSVLELEGNLAVYRKAVLEAWPGVRADSWFGQFFYATERRVSVRRCSWKSAGVDDRRYLPDRRKS